HVQLAVIRQDQMRLVADQQPVPDVDAQAGQLLDLLEQRLRIDDHAVANGAHHAVVEDARRNQVQHELLAADIDRVAGVVAALITRHPLEARRHQIDDLSLAFVAELGAENDDVHTVSTVSYGHKNITLKHGNTE